MKRILLSSCILFLGLAGLVAFSQGDDWLDTAFQESHESFADPFSLDLEADDLLKTSNTIGVGGIGQSDSVLVRFARFLLRLTVIIAIPLIIYTGIRIALSFGDKAKMQSALKMLGNVILGILLAMASVMIIFLVTALMRSSLNFFG